MNESEEFPVPRCSRIERESESPGIERSVLGFEEYHSLADKIGLTLGFLTMGPLLGIFFAMALVGPTWSPTWRWILERFVTLLAVFYFSSLIFIWWRPHWLKTHYRKVEKRLIQGIGFFFLSIFLYGVAGAILSLFGIGANQF